MRIISLNIFGGSYTPELLEFFERYKEVEVFLLQEVFRKATEKSMWHEGKNGNIHEEIASVLQEGHDALDALGVFGEWGLCSFLHYKLPFVRHDNVFVHNNAQSAVQYDGTSIGRNISCIHLKGLTLINFHGMWTGNGKGDTYERLEQSRKIIQVVKGFDQPVILCGDFNLSPETESLKMLEEELGLRNLIKDYGVTDTRTIKYTKENRFADYVLIDPTIRVVDFRVLPDVVSDHAPLYLEIE